MTTTKFEVQIRNMLHQMSPEKLHEMIDIVATSPDNMISSSDDVPDGLVTLNQAARDYDIKVTRIRNWVQRGHLEEQARLRGPGLGRILVRRLGVEQLIAHPPQRTGRPPSDVDAVLTANTT